MNANIKVDFRRPTGKRVMPLHGFNSGPMTKVFTYDARPLFVEGGFPYVRLHDVEYPYGSGEFVDIPCVFKNFDADENDPASYNFTNTDEYIRQSLAVGSKIIYRLGVSIEHSPHKRYIDPPRDYGKWARICEHIIRHYNEGWADGYAWNIEYWEIWNEADLDRAGGGNVRCWSGTVEQFADLYVTAATHLKSCFPHLRIGGCGFSKGRNSFTEAFLKNIAARQTRVPLDFYSWHRYADRPEKLVADARDVRVLLTEVGYGDAESILDEWNMMYGWDRPNQAESYRAMKDHRGAAFYAGALCALQTDTDVAISTNFEADVVKEFCGICNVKDMCIGGPHYGDTRVATMEPTKGFYAFKSFNLLYRLGEQATLTCDNERIFTAAAVGEDGVGVLVANANDEDASITLDLTGVRGAVAVRLTDERHTNEKLMEIAAGETLALTLTLPAQSFVCVGTDLPDPVPTYRP